MIRYYSYYSSGGYKLFYLGSEGEEHPYVYHLALMERYRYLVGRADTPESQRREAQAALDRMSRYPDRIKSLSDVENYGLPLAEMNAMVYRGGYIVAYRQLGSGADVIGLSDLPCNNLDDIGRPIPYLFLILGDSDSDRPRMERIAAAVMNCVDEVRGLISPMLGFDNESGGLRFAIGECNDLMQRLGRIEKLNIGQGKGDGYTFGDNPRVCNVLLAYSGNKKDVVLYEQGLSQADSVVLFKTGSVSSKEYEGREDNDSGSSTGEEIKTGTDGKKDGETPQPNTAWMAAAWLDTQMKRLSPNVRLVVVVALVLFFFVLGIIIGRLTKQ